MNKPESDIDRAMEIFRFLSPGSDFVRVVVIEGVPKSKARPRFGRNGRAYALDEQVAAEQALGWRLKESFAEPLDGNLAVGCIFYRPTSHRVDVDNMLKHVMDSANLVVWHDDYQVTAQVGIVELDAERPRTVIVIGRHISSMERSGHAEKSIVCPQCGVRFTSKQHRPKFCSRACSSRSRGEDLSAQVPCAWCRKAFHRRSAGARFCSNACRLASLNAPTRGRPLALCVACGARLSKAGYKHCRACWVEGKGRRQRDSDDPGTDIRVTALGGDA
jgi:Holliday junction resolvase RusA-like endonuclease/endogenous inhibitor of DNA gyrase (YacG/DUF329 family)